MIAAAKSTTRGGGEAQKISNFTLSGAIFGTFSHPFKEGQRHGEHIQVDFLRPKGVSFGPGWINSHTKSHQSARLNFPQIFPTTVIHLFCLVTIRVENFVS